MLKIARAFGQRPNDVLNWDFYEEYLPALAEISENPAIEELAMMFFSKKEKKITSKKPIQTDIERKKAFNELREKAKKRRLQNAR